MAWNTIWLFSFAMLAAITAVEGKVSQKEIVLYVTMPFISGVVGYVTNVLALKMTFYPIEFFGIKIWQPKDQPLGLIGWQGIVPCKAAKMAATTADLMLNKLIDLKEVFSRLDSDQMAEVLEPGMLAVLDDLVNDLAHEYFPSTWHSTPVEVRNEIVLKALETVPVFMRSYMADLKRNVNDVLDVKYMIVTNIEKDKSLLNKIFLEVGAKEMTFIERSGFYFGFLFGILQTGLWWFYKGSWVLPVGGFVVGYLTNYLALFMIFKPVEPKVVCGIRLHGLFLKRQQEVSTVFSRMVAGEVLHSEAIWESILTGPKKKAFNDMTRIHMHLFVDEMLGNLKMLVQHMVGNVQFHNITDRLASQLVKEMPKVIRFGHAYTNRALGIEKTLESAMQSLCSKDFEGVLHPVFEEDELKLILIGGALGAAVGVFQLLIMFGGS